MNGKREVREEIRYSRSFKLKVVAELEQGGESFGAMREKYGIRGASTVQRWVRQYGNGSRGKVIRVETPEAQNEAEKLRRRVRALETALADANVELSLERAFARIACRRAGITDVEAFKKKLDGKPPMK